jgi:prepilin-type N-terminal cleavage/methylation domain-containing protein
MMSQSQRERRAVDLRRGYTLLELMIALSLLSVLVVLIWSLLSTFSTAENRASRAAQRIQMLRGVRQMLENDLGRAFAQQKKENESNRPELNRNAGEEMNPTLSVTESNSEISQEQDVDNTAFAFAATDEGEFEGDSQGFTCSIYLDSNPTSWLSSLVNEAADQWASEPVSQVMPSIAGVRYELETEIWGEEEVMFLVRETQVASPESLDLGDDSPDPDEYLDLSDLYRNEEPSLQREEQANELPLRFGPMVDARFRYCDGQSWTSFWTSQGDGELPVAVEISFDLPSSRLRPPEPDMNLEDGILDEESSLSELPESSLLEQTEEPLLTEEDLYGDEAMEDAREFRVVVFVRPPRNLPESLVEGESK